jgi:hypothetical protein
MKQRHAPRVALLPNKLNQQCNHLLQIAGYTQNVIDGAESWYCHCPYLERLTAWLFQAVYVLLQEWGFLLPSLQYLLKAHITYVHTRCWPLSPPIVPGRQRRAVLLAGGPYLY